jgi:hypothetical protein
LRKIRLIALAAAAAAVLSGGPLTSHATAMTAALPSLRAAAKAAVPIERVRTVCGISGCAAVFTKRIQKPPRKFTTTAVPLVVSGTPAPAPAPAAASTKPWPLSLLH